MSTPSITKARRKTLRHLCKARCNGDRAETKDLIHKMEKHFARMGEDQQDEMLDTLARSVEIAKELAAATSKLGLRSATGGCGVL